MGLIACFRPPDRQSGQKERLCGQPLCVSGQKRDFPEKIIKKYPETLDIDRGLRYYIRAPVKGAICDDAGDCGVSR